MSLQFSNTQRLETEEAGGQKLSPLNTSILTFKGGFCAYMYAISTKISCADRHSFNQLQFELSIVSVSPHLPVCHFLVIHTCSVYKQCSFFFILRIFCGGIFFIVFFSALYLFRYNAIYFTESTLAYQISLLLTPTTLLTR